MPRADYVDIFIVLLRTQVILRFRRN